MASFTGFKKLGGEVLDYMMRHRPMPDEEMSMGFHDLDNLFPGIYSGKHKYPTWSGSKIDEESMRAIMTAQGNPDAMVDVYRAVPKGIRDFNTGDWVTTSKAYAKEHGKHALEGDYDIIKGKARAADISSPGDSIAEQGYWGDPMIGKVTRGLLPLFAAGGAAAAMSPDEAQAASVNGFRGLFKDAWNAGKTGSIYAGEYSPRRFAEIKSEYPNAKNSVYVPLHVGDSRVLKEGWSVDRAADAIADMLDSENGDLVKNWKPAKNGEKNYAQHGTLLPYDVDPLFSPFFIDNLGNIQLKTTFSPSEARLNKLGYGVDGGKPIISRSSDTSLSKPSTQPLPVSAVTPQPSMGNNIRGLDGWVKKNMPAIGGGVSAPLFFPDEVQSQSGSNSKNSAVDGGLLRQFLLGTRGVLEGVGGAADYVRDPLNSLNGMLGGNPEYFRNPGVVLSDAMGLPLPQNDTERSRVGLNQGVSGALAESAAGGGIAKYGAGKAADFGRFVADSPWLNSAVGGILGYFAGGDR